MRVMEPGVHGGFMDFLAFSKKIRGPTGQVTIRVPKSILEQAEKIKKETGLKTARALIYLMVQGIERLEADKAKPKNEPEK